MTGPALRVALINPNTSRRTTDAMVRVARETFAAAGAGRTRVDGLTARAGPEMIVDGAALATSAGRVVEMALRRVRAGPVDAFVVGAFGDPGLGEVRARTALPAAGIAEAALVEAAAGGRSFGIVTTTPGLCPDIRSRVVELGLTEGFRGIRVTPGDPVELVRDPAALTDLLRTEIRRFVEQDRVGAVVVGGGPLAAAADVLARDTAVPVVAPVPAACRRLLAAAGR